MNTNQRRVGKEADDIPEKADRFLGQGLGVADVARYDLLEGKASWIFFQLLCKLRSTGIHYIQNKFTRAAIGSCREVPPWTSAIWGRAQRSCAEDIPKIKTRNVLTACGADIIPRILDILTDRVNRHNMLGQIWVSASKRCN